MPQFPADDSSDSSSITIKPSTSTIRPTRRVGRIGFLGTPSDRTVRTVAVDFLRNILPVVARRAQSISCGSPQARRDQSALRRVHSAPTLIVGSNIAQEPTDGKTEAERYRDAYLARSGGSTNAKT